MEGYMFRFVVLVVFVVVPGLLLAQAPAKNQAALSQKGRETASFDPAEYFSSLRINQMYGNGEFAKPEGMTVAFEDSIRSNERAIGFSMHFTPQSGSGWQIWLDFDADVYYRPRLVRMLAQRPLAEGEDGTFAAYRERVSSVLATDIGAPEDIDDGYVRWPWLTRTSYYLSLRETSLDETPWLLLVLQREQQ